MNHPQHYFFGYTMALGLLGTVILMSLPWPAKAEMTNVQINYTYSSTATIREESPDLHRNFSETFTDEFFTTLVYSTSGEVTGSFSRAPFAASSSVELTSTQLCFMASGTNGVSISSTGTLASTVQNISLSLSFMLSRPMYYKLEGVFSGKGRGNLPPVDESWSIECHFVNHTNEVDIELSSDGPGPSISEKSTNFTEFGLAQAGIATIACNLQGDASAGAATNADTVTEATLYLTFFDHEIVSHMAAHGGVKVKPDPLIPSATYSLLLSTNLIDQNWMTVTTAQGEAAASNLVHAIPPGLDAGYFHTSLQ